MSRENWMPEFKARLMHFENELKMLYMGLYHNDEQAYDYFTGMLYRAWENRPEALRKLDRERVSNPAWYQGHSMVGMLMYVNAFAGNLQGVKEKLSYVQDCGVNYLHLMPLLESPAGEGRGKGISGPVFLL